MKINHIIPCLGYHDALTAIEWLCRAFGFEKHRMYMEDHEIVGHAELKAGNVMIMVSTQKHDSPYSKLTKHPATIGGFETQSPYLVVDKIEEHYAQAIKEGAKVVIALREETYGGKNYSCYDLEGHLWNFGSYDPWR